MQNHLASLLEFLCDEYKFTAVSVSAMLVYWVFAFGYLSK